MIKSDEESVGKFNRFRVKKDASMKVSPVLRKPRLDDNLFSLKNPIERQSQQSNGCQTQKYKDGRTLACYTSQQNLLKTKKEPARMFKIRKQHFANLKMNLADMVGQKDEAYTSSGRHAMSRQQTIPTKTISIKTTKNASP